MTVRSGEEIFRDYETDGVAASGTHDPVKSEIRAWMAAVETAVGLNQSNADLHRAEMWRRRLQFNSAI